MSINLAEWAAMMATDRSERSGKESKYRKAVLDFYDSNEHIGTPVIVDTDGLVYESPAEMADKRYSRTSGFVNSVREQIKKAVAAGSIPVNTVHVIRDSYTYCLVRLDLLTDDERKAIVGMGYKLPAPVKAGA